MKTLLHSLLIGVAAISYAKADFTSYLTDFSSNASTIPANQSFVPGFPIPSINNVNYQDNWYSGLDASYQTNPYSGQVSQNWLAPAGIVSAGGGNYLFVGGAQVNNDATNGFYAPTNEVTFAKRSIAEIGNGVFLGNSLSFSSTFLIDGGSNGFHDSFGWTLFNKSGDQLVSFDFNPITNGSIVSYNIGATSYANDSDVLSQPLIANGPAATNLGSVLNIQTNTTYAFRFEVANIGIAGQQTVSLWSYNSGTNFPPTALATNQVLYYTDFSPSIYNPTGDTNIGLIGLTWVISDTNTVVDNQFVNFGDNAIYVSALSIPEPKSWLLMGISGLIMVVALRRKKA